MKQANTKRTDAKITDAEKRHTEELIEKKVEEAVKERHELEHYIKTETRAAAKSVRNDLIVFTIIAGLLGFLGKDFIIDAIAIKALSTVSDQAVRTEADKMIATEVSGMISNKVPEIIADRVPVMISDKVSVVEADMLNRLANQSNALTEQERCITERISIINSMMAASTGSRPDYDRLCHLMGLTNDVASFVAPTVNGIRRIYQDKKIHRESFDVRLGPAPKGFAPIDYYSYVVRADLDHNCDGAINELVGLGRVECVATLVYAVQTSKRLQSVYLAIAGIERLTKTSFSALGVDEVNQWWGKNSTNETYHRVSELCERK